MRAAPPVSASRDARLAAALLGTALAGLAPPRPAWAEPASVVAQPVVTCTSLANLRMVLRGARDDAAAAVAIATDPKSDLGCTVLDRAAVTGIGDHVALNGRAYDCLSLLGTSICHWTVAGAVALPPGKPPSEAGRR